MAGKLSLTNNLSGLIDTPEPVIVDNTNLTAWELAPYVRLAELYGYNYQILTFWCDPLVCAKRNVHGVPVDRIFCMNQTLLNEKLPPHWKHRIILNKE